MTLLKTTHFFQILKPSRSPRLWKIVKIVRFGVICLKVNDNLCSKIHLILLPAGQVCPSVICFLGDVHKSRHHQILQINSFDNYSLHSRPKSYQSSFKTGVSKFSTRYILIFFHFARKLILVLLVIFHPHRNERRIFDQKMFN